VCKEYLELLFRTVFALPNASRTGLDCHEAKLATRFQLQVKVVWHITLPPSLQFEQTEGVYHEQKIKNCNKYYGS
jgi:hypothetical protein